MVVAHDQRSSPRAECSSIEEYVVRLLERNSECEARVLENLRTRWIRDFSDRQSFIDFLKSTGVLEPVAARAVTLAWEGLLDERDTRQLFDHDRILLRIKELGGNNSEKQETAQSAAATATRAPGLMLGRYRLQGVLGTRRQRAGYLAVHPTLDVPVVVKPLERAVGPDGEAARLRLRNEARLLARIQHPHVVRVWDYEEADAETPFLVLDYVPGESLNDRLRSGPLCVEAGFRLAAQVCLALRAAWRVGVLHLDVKPGNILSAGADGPFVLTDFGVARCLLNSDTSSSGRRPRPSERVAGTLQYMAPEQFENCVDHRSDMYALGLTLYYALSGRPAVVENDFHKVMLWHKTTTPEPLHRITPDIRWEVSDLVNRMTAKDPDQRFATYDDLLKSIEHAFGLPLEHS